MRDQKVNAGGILSPEEVVGREPFIKAAWLTLGVQGLYLTGERRMGKSSIVRDKMGSEPPTGYKLVYFDVSNADTPFVFVDDLFRKAKEMAKTGGKFKLNTLEVLRRLVPGLEIADMVRLPESLAPSWKEMLHAVLADFASSETQLILAFDEMPLMLDKIKRKSGEALAMDVLDTLRQERQSDKRLRMLYTGSLGLHHVLTGLQAANFQNSPINDLKAVEVGPLVYDDAADLTWRLLNGMEIFTSNAEKLARHISQITHGMPFYIQNLVGDLSASGEKGEPDTADRLLMQRLTDLTDPWDLGYYVTRIKTHYQATSQPMAFAFLDGLALASEAQTVDDLLGSVDPQKITVDEEAAQQILILLGKDHYIAQNEDGAYHFRYSLIARAWTYKRGLVGKKRR